MDKHVADRSRRPEWVQPKVNRLEAGAAESGPANVNEDGGGTLDPRS